MGKIDTAVKVLKVLTTALPPAIEAGKKIKEHLDKDKKKKKTKKKKK